MEKEKIDWYQNCLTGGIHSGRDGALWSLPLGYAAQIFEAKTLREIVLERIYSDAMQLVRHGEGFTQEWADGVKQKAEEMYERTLQRKVEEFRNYYLTPGWEADQERTVRLIKEDKLNILYEPLHGHDSINLLCRIIGVSSSR